MIPLLITLALFFFPAAADAAFDLTEWTWQSPIEIDSPSGFVRLPIPPEVFDESQASLDDLRVLDSDHSLIPHVLHWGRIREVQELEWRPARLLNQTYLPGKYSRVTIDFGEAVEKNRIQVALSGENYRRRVLLEGSQDSRAWDIVAEDLWLFEVSFQGQHFKVDTLKFPANSQRYLRLTVYNMNDDPRRISIETVKAGFSRAGGEKELTQVPVKNITVSTDEKLKQSIFDMDLGFRNLPITSLKLVIGTNYFYRGYELLGRNQPTEKISRKTETGWDKVEREVPWASIRRGMIYRTQGRKKVGESQTIEEIRAPYRYLQIRILNGDNPPLQLEGVTVFRRETSLVFQATKGRTYMLIGGNAGARAANYDLGKAVQGLGELKVPVVALGLSVPLKIQTEKTAPWSERHGAVIWVVLIAAASVVLLLIMRSLRSLRSTR